MSGFPAPSHHADRTARSWRLRAGIVRTFGSLFLVICVLLVLMGGELLYDAFAHPLTANAGQVLVGSVCVAFALLVIVFLMRDAS